MKRKITFKKATKIATDTISRLLTLFVILALLLGTAKIFVDVGSIFEGSIDTGFKILVTDILGMIVALELFRGLMDYIELHRVRLTLITEVTLIFVMREVMISLYQHKMAWQEIAAMSILIAVLGGLRTMAIIRSPGVEINNQ
ncbi:MAG: phosphate-starvation-inducible PsiE family protein [Proteobacteria bacterium]|nr:phosphate-starvation-inducible PsiE family protein [Pseudomonadota bacterium]